MKATFLFLTLLLSTLSLPPSPTHSVTVAASTPRSLQNRAEDYNHLGTTKFQRGDNQGAISDFDQAIAIDPKYAEAYTNRGVAKFGLGDKQGAIADYDRAIAIGYQDVLVFYNRGVAKF